MKKLVLLASLVLGSFIVMQAQQSDSDQLNAVNPNAPVITFEKDVHDYGTIYQNGNGTCYFAFTNTGKEPLILDKPRSSCGCTVPTWPKQPILPGQSDTIKVTYDTKRLGRIHKTVSIISNANNNSVLLTIKGQVIAKPKEEMPEKNLDEQGSPLNR